MLNGFWEQIKSGSDIRGVAAEENSSQEVTLTNDVVEKICLAFAFWLSGKAGVPCPSLTVAIGHDSRISASRIKNASINALRSVGISVYDCGLASTPAMFTATSVLDCSAAIQITASHHPSNRNGFKFFTSKGGLSQSDIENILELAQNERFPKFEKRGNVRRINLMSYYCDKLKKLIKESIDSKEDFDLPLKGYKIAVDAGNGAGGFFAADILKVLGADISGSVFLEPDGTFPNHIPNPEDKEAMKSVSNAVTASGADLGIIFDTDVDRAAFVNSKGKPIDKNKLIALSASVALKDSSGGIIVTDSVTSDYLKLFIEKCGGTQFRYKRGYHNVISMAQKINQSGSNCPLAIESSGHAAFKENNFTDDGAYLASKIIIEMVNLKKSGKTLDDSLKDLIDAKEQISVRIPVKSDNEEETALKIITDFRNYANSNRLYELDKDNVEGVRIKFSSKHQKGWLLLRKSLHDPVMVLYAESYVVGGMHSVLNLIKPFLKKYPELDLTEFDKITKRAE